MYSLSWILDDLYRIWHLLLSRILGVCVCTDILISIFLNCSDSLSLWMINTEYHILFPNQRHCWQRLKITKQMWRTDFTDRQTHKYPTGATCTMAPTLPGPSASVVRNVVRSCILTIQSHSQPIPHESCGGQPVSTGLMNNANASEMK